MNLLEEKAIFLQIVDRIKDRILEGIYVADERVPSVREIAEEMEVNPNTAMRSIERMQMEGLIYSKRGLGYFVSANALEVILEQRRERFRKEVLPALKREMKMLGIDPKELEID
ncbi:GntR family transcriptional regulator [Porphyromonas pogonae]|uniref:GntR family transcriptional regulator n=1 Tax=Porphyromonas pogonae TaxID=867595 RepID=UPI002E784A14|nr:GntR family transcriptional regulator [Porphyromonas pogonae]